MGIIQNKRGLNFKDSFFAIIVVGMVIAAMGVIIGEWDTQYNSGVVYDLGDDFNKLTEVSGTAQIEQGRLSPNDADPGSDFESNTFRSAYGIISNIFAPFRVVFGEGGMIDAVTDRLGLPDYIRVGLVTLMVFGMIWAIVAIIFRIPGGSA